MIQILLIAEESAAATHVSALLSSPDHKVTRKDDVDSAQSLLSAGIFDLAAICTHDDAGLLRKLASVRALSGNLPLVVITGQASPATEAQLYAAGADIVLHGPVTSASFAAATKRLLPTAAKPTGGSFPPHPTPAVPMLGTLPTSALEVLRGFSQVLGYSLDHKLFSQQFVMRLREILSVNRIAIFLEAQPSVSPSPNRAETAARLTCAAAVGISGELLECIELSRRSGIGQYVTKHGQILRLDMAAAYSGPPRDEAKIQREFDILGCQVALPISDRERAIGVALIGGRVTGTPFTETELQLVYHLLEELGMAVKNSWLHHQLSANHRLFSDVLGAITSGSIVVSSDLTVIHANRAFLQFLRGDGRSDPTVDFAELPAPLATALHDLAEKGRLAEPFHLPSPRNPQRTYRVSLIPFPGPENRLPQPAMALVEDYTQIQAAQRAEIEASNLRLTALIAKRFAHEIRNSLVPLTTHHQLFDTEYGTPDFHDSLKASLGRETSRIHRFTEQMLYLSQQPAPAEGTLSATALLQDAFATAAQNLGVGGQLEIIGDDEGALVRANRASLSHAFQEVFGNSLQSSGNAPGPVQAVLSVRHNDDEAPQLIIRFRDSGPGFTPEIAARATEPFFTTRNTGIGLGLTVARRIVEHHAGHLEVRPRTPETSGEVVISLPVA